jgi:hypothetical protein
VATKRRAREIYEDSVRWLSPAERLRLLVLIAESLEDEPGLSEEPVALHDIRELHGLGRELWAGIDAQEYVNALREGRAFPGERRPDRE